MYLNSKILAFIANSKYLSKLSNEEIISLSSHTSILKLEMNQKLFSKGEPSDAIYILLEGQLVSKLTLPSGEEISIGTVHPFETIGELGVISKESRSLTVQAVTKCELLKVPADFFREVWNTHPRLVLELSKLIVSRSIKNIASLTKERPFYSVIFIFPLKTPYETYLKKAFKSHLNVSSTFIATDEVDFTQLVKFINDAQSEYKNAIVFMHKWEPVLINRFAQQNVHLYLILDENEKIPTQYYHSEIEPHLQNITNLRIELILLHPEERRIINTAKFLALTKFQFHHHLRLNHEEDLARICRFINGKANVLVLGGGGAKGLAHLGIIQALKHKNIPIDAIGGTSIGSTIGACFLLTQDIYRTFTIFSRFTQAAQRSVKFYNLTWPIISLFNASLPTKILIETFENNCIEDLLIPFFAISSNLTEKKETVHKTGLIWIALRASAAVPGIFPPVVINGQLFLDGGLINNLPVDVMRSFVGPEHTIIASSLASDPKKNIEYSFPPVLTFGQTLAYKLGLAGKKYLFPSFLETFYSALLLGSSTREYKNRQDANILISPDVSQFKMLSINAEREKIILRRGYDAAIKTLEQHEKKEQNDNGNK